MESVFHEKQEGSLCAQHCLNALLQNQYFSAVDLAQIGRRLDERERERMAEGGITSNEYQNFIEQPSSNYDDSGFFSIQVITEALSVWGLDVVVFNSQNPVAVKARDDPREMSAFICNYLQHWFSVRKIGNQWFNLNSLLSGPELISDTYLSLFLTQLQQEGYSIFIVVGPLPECEADQLLRLMPAVQTVKPKLLTERGATDTNGEDEDQALMEALRVSKEMIDHDDSSLQAALQLSMEGYFKDQSTSSETKFHQGTSSSITTPSQSCSSSNPAPQSQEELRLKRLAFLDKQSGTTNKMEEDTSQTTQPSSNGESDKDASESSDDELLRQAIAMSMEQGS